MAGSAILQSGGQQAGAPSFGARLRANPPPRSGVDFRLHPEPKLLIEYPSD
jgi:hypothetical protein